LVQGERKKTKRTGEGTTYAGKKEGPIKRAEKIEAGQIKREKSLGETKVGELSAGDTRGKRLEDEPILKGSISYKDKRGYIGEKGQEGKLFPKGDEADGCKRSPKGSLYNQPRNDRIKGEGQE